MSLNSTGLITSTGENQRALLLATESNPELKQSWGLQLEQWQDFFWKHRGQNLNADQGFNEFFRWLRIIAPAIANEQQGAADLISQALQIKDTPRELPTGFTLQNAARLMEVLRLLFPLPNSKTVGLVPNGLLPFSWLAQTGPLESARLGTRELFRLLPVLAYCMERIKQQDDKWEHLTRVARYFYNVQRLDRVGQAGLQPLADFCAEATLLAQELGKTETGDITGLIDIAISRRISLALLPAEEKQKLMLYQLAGADRPEMEHLLGQLEDDAYNQGQVGHLFIGDSLATTNLQNVQRVHQRYFALGLNRLSNRRTLQSLLLLWGNCTVQDRESYLYEQYNYGAWPNIIRTTGGGFQAFFLDFLHQDVDVATYYEHNKRKYYETKTTAKLLVDSSFDNQLRLLALLFDYFQSLEPETDNISLWLKGAQIGYFYPDYIEGRDYSLPEDQAIFDEQTLRFWNVSNRMTSANYKVKALLPWAYELFKKHNPQALSYRQFLDARLEEVGAKVALEADLINISQLPI
ncbi:hypothetical protein H9L05_15680 [Hymenobacter qilianensis]|uniref:Uncharacterized protein n=1 Tax=Hymenobacter qilianensis TaxID=1385715 RepID=A0A7H0GT34_9BACT|nr:hypothetical protein [Hymenobacter qilianensis]QNP51450.1 hypothetical protein H9L05_15680 [Hymenobacter qilianensis]